MSEIGHTDIQLSKPIDIDGTKVDTLRMREPLVKDQLTAEEMAEGSRGMMEIMLFANLCGIPHQVVQGMRVKDYAKLQAAYAGFIN